MELCRRRLKMTSKQSKRTDEEPKMKENLRLYYVKY